MFFYFFYFFIYLFFYHHLFLFLCFCKFIWLQVDLRGNWTKVIFYFCLILTYFLFYQLKIIFFLNYYTLSNSFYFSAVGAILSICFSFIFSMEHIFHKIILNIYFDHIHIMCLYRVFSVLCTGYMLVHGLYASYLLWSTVTLRKLSIDLFYLGLYTFCSTKTSD